MAFDPRHNVVHTSGGRLAPKAPTSADDVRRIVAEALASQARSGIVLNFHGGLVSAADALATAADRLYPLYADEAGAYPIFFVWESGFLEAPLNNLDEISREPIFREFVKKSGEWALREMQPPALTGARRAKAVDSPARFRADVDAWFKTGRARRKLPKNLRDFRIIVSDTIFPTRAAAPKMVSDTIIRDIHESIRTDAKFQRAVLRPSSIDKEAAAKLFPRKRGAKTRAAVPAWIGVAKAVADIVARILARVRNGRDHGKYVTIVEEVLRELYIGQLGRTGWWDRMKGDTADAFKPGDEFGGTVFLEALRDTMATAPAPRITLIGHSTGAVYIGNFLRAAAQFVPDLPFDVIFEAPAATHDFLARVIEEHASRIAHFRLFGMSDERERADVLVPVIYPASLLYFVSGLLEDEPDQPIVGMQRFLDARFDAERFPNVEVCREFFARYDEALVWSPQDGPPGCASTARHHQDLDDRDPATLASVARILEGGFSC